MEKYPYVFFGSAPIGPIALESLRLADYSPSAIIDDPKLPLEEQLAIIDAHQPTFLLVVGYGAILKQEVLDTVAGQVLNIHPSYLPEYRGPAPVVQAILDGARETGVTLMEIDKQMDHGPIVAQERFPLRGNEYPDELYKLLTTKGVSLFLENLEDYLSETSELIPQNHTEATFTHFIQKGDGALDPSKPAEELERQIRAFQGWPRSWLTVEGKRVIIDRAHVEQGSLIIDQVQPENGKSMSFEAYLAGQRMSKEAWYKLAGLS